uniref:C2H2-type domain-containing protein n=1 Tax=Panagrolaimus sp. ES5 TaxID=591445 RepID=A0AC34FWD2_9BILA
MQFKASKRLLNPNEHDSNDDLIPKENAKKSFSQKQSNLKVTSKEEKKNGRKKREKKVQQNVKDDETMKMETSESVTVKKRQYKKRVSSKPEAPAILHVIQCDQCGEYFEKENAFFDHKKHHAFARLAIRASIPTYKNPLSPEDEAVFSAQRLHSSQKKKQDIIHISPPLDSQSISTAALDKVPTIKVFNLRTQRQLSKDLTPIPIPSGVHVMNLDQNDNEKSDDEI